MHRVPTVATTTTSSVPSTYNKRATIPNSGHGNEFHLRVAMFNAFYLAYTENAEFTLHVEDIEYGDFDDLVINTGGKIIAWQFKHHLSAREQPLNDFVTYSKTGQKLTFYKYFDALFDKLGSKEAVTYAFCTNNHLPDQIAECLVDNRFSPDFYAGTTPALQFTRNLFYASIVKHSAYKNDLPAPESEQITYASLSEFANQCLASDYFSGAIQSKITTELAAARRLVKKQAAIYLADLFQTTSVKSDITLWDLYCVELTLLELTKIKRFFQRIVFRFEEPNLIAYEKKIREAIRQQFNTTNDALYFAFYYEFRAHFIGKKAIVYTSERVKELFTRWYAKCIHSERLFALTQHYLRQRQIALPLVHFARDYEIAQIQLFLNQSRLLLLIHGASGIGKSTLIRAIFEANKPADGQYLFLAASELVDYLETQSEKDLKQLADTLKVVFIDNAESLVENDKSKALIELLRALIAKKVKVVLLFGSEHNQRMQRIAKSFHTLSRTMEIRPLSIETVLAQYPHLASLTTINSFRQLLTTPIFLNLIVQHYDALKREALLVEPDIKILQDFLIHLVLQPTHPKEAKKRKMLLRKLIYQAADAYFIPVTEAELKMAAELVEKGVLVKNKDKAVRFSHKIYEEYMVRRLTLKCLRDVVETNDDVLVLVRTINKRLVHPMHRKIVFDLLLQHEDFLRLLRKEATESTNLDLHPIMQLLLIGLNKRNTDCITFSCEALPFLALLEPKNILMSMVFFFSRPKDQRHLEQTQLEQLILAIKITIAQPGCFGWGYQLFLSLITREKLPDTLFESLSDELPQYFCHSGIGFEHNFQERMSFLRSKFAKPLDVFEESYLYEGLYMAANPVEYLNVNPLVESRLNDLALAYASAVDRQAQARYQKEALDLLIAHADKPDAAAHIEKILEMSIGSVYFISEASYLKEDSGSSETLYKAAEAEDESTLLRKPQLHDAPCYLLERIIITPEIREIIDRRKSELLALDEEHLSTPHHDKEYGYNHEECSALIRAQLARIHQIIEQKPSISDVPQVLFPAAAVTVLQGQENVDEKPSGLKLEPRQASPR